MNIVSKLVRLIGVFALAVFLSGCVAPQGPVVYNPGVAPYEPVPPGVEVAPPQAYVAPNIYPVPVYGPRYAYDPYPFYRAPAFNIAIFGARYHDRHRHYGHRGKPRRHKHRHDGDEDRAHHGEKKKSGKSARAEEKRKKGKRAKAGSRGDRRKASAKRGGRKGKRCSEGASGEKCGRRRDNSG